MTQPRLEDDQNTQDAGRLLRSAARTLLSDFAWSLVGVEALAELAAPYLQPAPQVSTAQATAACQTAYSRPRVGRPM